MKTIIAAFCNQAAGTDAIAFLRSQRVDDIRVLDSSVRGGLDQLRALDIPDDRAEIYAELMRRGAVVVAAHTAGDARALAEELDRRGSLDLHAARDRWRRSGWNGFDPNAPAFDASERDTECGALMRESGTARGAAPSAREPEREMAREMAREPLREPAREPVREMETQQQRDFDVIEEDVVVGKRDVALGGVRVHTFIAERPVREDVQLREEHIEVTREPVNERISTAFDSTLGEEEEFELTARGEEVVVGKEARVVERVHVGKTERTRTEHIEETERRRDVEVEPIEAAEPPTTERRR